MFVTFCKDDLKYTKTIKIELVNYFHLSYDEDDQDGRKYGLVLYTNDSKIGCWYSSKEERDKEYNWLLDYTKAVSASDNLH